MFLESRSTDFLPRSISESLFFHLLLVGTLIHVIIANLLLAQRVVSLSLTLI